MPQAQGPPQSDPEFNSAFIDGVTGSALKKDNVAKHKKSDMHSKAVNMERMPAKTIHFYEKKKHLI